MSAESLKSSLARAEVSREGARPFRGTGALPGSCPPACGGREVPCGLLRVATAGTMFLTALLRRNRIPGRQWIGKHRRPRTVSSQAKQNMIRRLEIEAENHYWLSMPYLTAEQEYGHAAERRAAAFEAIKAASMSKFPPHRFVVDQLDHLNVCKKWS